MNENKEVKPFLEVRSLELLSAINNAHALSFLRRVRHEEDTDGKRWPVYCFLDMPRPRKVYDAWIAEHGEDSRDKDDPASWSGYAADQIGDFDAPKVNTKNYHVINRCFYAGLMGNLVAVKGEGTKTSYRFIATPEFLAIKTEEDAESLKEWLAKQQEGGSHE